MSTTETRYKVNGMKCGGCIASANEALSKLPGFVEAEFDLEAGSGVVKGDVNPAAVVKALTDIGYPATEDQA